MSQNINQASQNQGNPQYQKMQTQPPMLRNVDSRYGFGYIATAKVLAWVGVVLTIIVVLVGISEMSDSDSSDYVFVIIVGILLGVIILLPYLLLIKLFENVARIARVAEMTAERNGYFLQPVMTQQQGQPMTPQSMSTQPIPAQSTMMAQPVQTSRSQQPIQTAVRKSQQ